MILYSPSRGASGHHVTSMKLFSDRDTFVKWYIINAALDINRANHFYGQIYELIPDTGQSTTRITTSIIKEIRGMGYPIYT